MFRSMIAEKPWVALLGAVVLVVVLTAVLPKCGGSKPEEPGEGAAVQAPSSEVAETEAKGADSEASPEPSAESAGMEQPGEESEPAAAPEAVAAGGPWLNVVGVVPLEAEPLKDQIVFFFDGPIVAPEQVNGQAVTALTIQPDPGGAVRVGDNFIGYRSPNIKSTLYTVTLSEHIQSKDGRKLNPANREYRFGGFSFRPEKVWQIESDATHSTVGIVFPTQVKLEDLKQHLAVVAEGGAPAAYELREGSTPNIAQLIFPGDTKWPVAITLSKGLPDATGALHLVENFTCKYPTQQYLQVSACDWGDFSPEYQQVQLRFSRPVVGASLGQYLSITDGRTNTAVPFEVAAPEANVNQVVTVHLETLEAVKLVVKVAKGLAGTEGVSLENDFDATLEKRPTPLELEQTWWQTRGRDGLVLVCNLDHSVDIREIREHFEVQPALANMRIEPTYGEGFQVYGDWDSKRTYEIRIKAGTKDREGLTLGETRARPVQAEEVPAYIGFGFDGKYYFPRHVAGGVLPLETRNLDKVTLVLHRMFPNNIAVAVNDTKAGTGSYEGEEGYYGDEERGLGAFAQSWSEEVAKKEVPPVRAPDRIAATPVKVDEIFPADKKGVYCLEARGERTTGEDRSSVQAWKLALFTEIGVLAHWQDQELVVFAHNLFSLEPLPLAKVTAYSSKNQVLGQGNTDTVGIARLGPFDAALGEPHVVVVECNHDYTFLELDAREDASSSKPEDMEAYNREGYDAFLYADRDLYRPGETVHLRWLVRKNFGDVVANVPLLVTVVKPNGRDLLTQTTTLSDVGTAGMDLETQKTYPTGKYRAKLTVPASDRSIGEYAFSVEEFVPNRIKTAVTVTAAEGAAADYLLPDQEYTIGVNAQHLFGAPAADRKSEALVVVMRGQFAPKEWPGFRFGNDAEFQSTTIQCGEAQTDEEGNAAFQFTYEAPPKVTFPLKAVALGRVFELGGRAVASTVEKSLFPSDICLGIAADTKAGGVQVTAAAVKPHGSAAELDKVTITLERRVWNYYVRRYYSHHEPNWTESFEEVESKEVALAAGRGAAAFAPKDYGYYRVRVHSDKTPQFSTSSFYSYGNRFQLAETGEPSLVKLTLDKERYEVGDEAGIRIESPFDGRGIVVLQTDHILDMIPVAIQNGAGVAKFRADNEHVPNVWAEVTIIHAVKTETTQVYPFSSFGMASVPVRDKRRELRVAFPSLPEEIRPGAKAEIQVATTDSGGAAMPAEITLAAVDEGIHSITDYQNPDPFGWLCRPRRPDYRRAHYYDKVAYDFEKPAAGGDMLLKMAKRLGATDETWIKSVALWSGAVRTDPEGKAIVTLDVPEFTGQLRLVAVGCSAGDQARPAAIGTTSGKMFVRRMYMMRTSMPRFLLPGDAIHCRANLFNHSDAACKAKVSWQGVGALEESAGSKELDIAARGEANCIADFVAGAAAGQGEIRWTAVILDAAGNEVERLIENDPIPVRTPAAFQSKHELAILKPGEGRTFRNQAFLDDARTELEIAVGASPQMRLEEALKHVVRYPYGCVEQTTSALMPMYVLRKDATLTGSVIDQALPVNSYIEAGIRRLFSMQTSSGGLSVWVGGATPYPYGSIYALHFLTLVKQGREFDLPKTSFEALQDYVRTLVGMEAPQDEEMPYFPTDHQSVLFQRAYAIYVLALDGDLDAIHEIQRFDTVTLPTAARFLLAAALAQNTGDVDRVRLYLTSAPSKPHTVTEPDGTLNSDIRNTAIELLAMLQIGDKAAGAQAAQQKLEKADTLIAWLEKSRYGTTQESAFAVTALGAYFDEIAANIAAAAATIEAPKGPKTIQGPAVFRDSFSGPAGVFTVTNTGGADLFVDFTTRGVPEKVEWQEVREGMAVQRQFLTSAGKPYADAVFRQGDTYIVQVTLRCAKQLPLKNVVVADLLPAGFEVENPRLDTTVMAGANLPNAIVPSYLDIRDDRVVTAYDAISNRTVHFYYVVRAVTPGTYQHPPIQAECMYDAAVRGVSMPSAMEVK